MLIAALLPDRGLLYRAAIDELIAVGSIHLEEAAMLRRVHRTSDGLCVTPTLSTPCPDV
jgi:hypothetical protein